MIDPRRAVFVRRLRPVRRPVLVAGGKGGVGKSACASICALLSAAVGVRTGLLDLDLHGASAHTFLGIEPGLPAEASGILPLTGPKDLHFMSVAPFSGERGLALRGRAVSEAIQELLAVTIWPELDLLFVDMPPGIGDEILDALRFFPRYSLLLVTTPSLPALRVTERLLSVVMSSSCLPHGDGDGGREVTGIIANMIQGGGATPADTFADGLKIPLLARIAYDPDFEAYIGKPERLLRSPMAADLRNMLHLLLPAKQAPPGQEEPQGKRGRVGGN